MMNAAVIATLLSLTAYAAADDVVEPTQEQAPQAPATRTTTADTLVVVTPNAPVVVTNGAPGAQEAPPAALASNGASNGAPMTNNWSDVSHINGTVVPVGEHNNYLNTYKKVNLSGDPIAMMFGYFQFAGSYAVSQNVALQLQLSAWSMSHGNDAGTEFALSAPIFLKRVYSGPFIEPGIVVHNDNNYDSYDCYDCTYSSPTTMTRTWVGPEMLVGYSWLFDSGLNMTAAVGASKKLSDNTGSSSDDPDFAGYFRVGYAF